MAGHRRSQARQGYVLHGGRLPGTGPGRPARPGAATANSLMPTDRRLGVRRGRGGYAPAARCSRPTCVCGKSSVVRLLGGLPFGWMAGRAGVSAAYGVASYERVVRVDPGNRDTYGREMECRTRLGASDRNAASHQITIAISLGDAGQAIAIARRVDPEQVPTVERRACLLVDISRAYAQWGKHEKALGALEAAARVASEEIRARDTVHRVVAQLHRSAPMSVRRQLIGFAERVKIAI